MAFKLEAEFIAWDTNLFLEFDFVYPAYLNNHTWPCTCPTSPFISQSPYKYLPLIKSAA
jgi:hypothetical protein